MKLLLVEDSVELAEWIVNLLRSESFVVDHIPDAERAESIPNNQNYDVALVDIRLPSP